MQAQQISASIRHEAQKMSESNVRGPAGLKRAGRSQIRSMLLNPPCAATRFTRTVGDAVPQIDLKKTGMRQVPEDIAAEIWILPSLGQGRPLSPRRACQGLRGPAPLSSWLSQPQTRPSSWPAGEILQMALDMTPHTSNAPIRNKWCRKDHQKSEQKINKWCRKDHQKPEAVRCSLSCAFFGLCSAHTSWIPRLLSSLDYTS